MKRVAVEKWQCMEGFDTRRSFIIRAVTEKPIRRSYDRKRIRRCADELARPFDFLAAGITLESHLIKQMEALLVGGLGFEILTFHKALGLLDDERIVHKEQGLLRHGGVKPPRAAGVRTGKVK